MGANKLEDVLVATCNVLLCDFTLDIVWTSIRLTQLSWVKEAVFYLKTVKHFWAFLISATALGRMEYIETSRLAKKTNKWLSSLKDEALWKQTSDGGQFCRGNWQLSKKALSGATFDHGGKSCSDKHNIWGHLSRYLRYFKVRQDLTTSVQFVNLKCPRTF